MKIFRHDIFISYCHADRQWVHALAKELKKEFRIFLDEWNVVSGRPWREQVEEGLRRSATGIIVLSPDAVQSGAVGAEITVLISKYWKEGRPLIPILYRDCEIPYLLATFQYIDFRDPDPGARKRAMTILRKAIRGKPLGPPTGLPRIKTRSPLPVPLAAVFIILILLCSLPLIIRAVYLAMTRNSTFANLKQTQKLVQTIDQKVSGGNDIRYSALMTGEQKYIDPTTGESIAKDIWENSRLIWRDYYLKDDIVARDKFEYDRGEVVGKVRYHLRNKRVFLIDYFTQDGRLIRKEYMRPDKKTPDTYIDDMQSPLPPPGIIFYR